MGAPSQQFMGTICRDSDTVTGAFGVRPDYDTSRAVWVYPEDMKRATSLPAHNQPSVGGGGSSSAGGGVPRPYSVGDNVMHRVAAHEHRPARITKVNYSLRDRKANPNPESVHLAYEDHRGTGDYRGTTRSYVSVRDIYPHPLELRSARSAMPAQRGKKEQLAPPCPLEHRVG